MQKGLEQWISSEFLSPVVLNLSQRVAETAEEFGGKSRLKVAQHLAGSLPNAVSN